MQLLPRDQEVDQEVEWVEGLLAWHVQLQDRKLKLQEEETLTTEDQLLSWVDHVMATEVVWATLPSDTEVVLAFPHSDTTQPSP